MVTLLSDCYRFLHTYGNLFVFIYAEFYNHSLSLGFIFMVFSSHYKILPQEARQMLHPVYLNSAYIHLSPQGCFCPLTFFATTGLNFSHHINQIYIPNKDNLQECCRLCDWVSLWCLVLWMNHLSSVCWYVLGKPILNDSSSVILI